MPAPDPRSILLRACGLSFLVRALVRASTAHHRALLHRAFAQLINEFVPCEAAEIHFTNTPPADHWLGFPLDVRGTPDASLHVRLAISHPSPDVLETLAAIATLCGIALDPATEVQRLTHHNALLTETIAQSQGRVIGSSPTLARLLEMVRRVAPRDTTVLILGETGTGKELIARAVHDQSPRHARPFVAINCAALTDTLLESELFGHEKGAFTGAVAQKKGKLELAEGGTVFLDEIGELAAPLQAKLLRVLQQRVFERVGGTTTFPLDIRLVAATNRDLEAESRAGRFREDLYHRLNVVTLRTPPLRDRREDIPILAAYFLERSAATCHRRVQGFSP
ncbi:MAG: sigma-54 dependent transcriptional regulator, partial [Bryobacteraceae bacterium]|nr:sigma-54 dependent transcriptional regulator [Bryobacteraceae bacterium]